MRENRIRKIWDNGGNVLNGWLQVPSSYVAEIMAHESFDSLTIDFEHGMLDFGDIVTMLQAISTTDVVPLVRVQGNDPHMIMKILDAGAYGIICPLIDDRADCEKFVAACRYGPQGNRSFGPARGFLYGGADYGKRANDTLLTFAMIETAAAVENLEAIMSVDGLDAVYIGPHDLAIGLDCEPTLEPKAEKVIAAYKKVLEMAEKCGVVAGVHAPNGEVARSMFEWGFRFVGLSKDTSLLAAATRAEIALARGEEPPAAGGIGGGKE